jgi:hypothetical protein
MPIIHRPYLYQSPGPAHAQNITCHHHAHCLPVKTSNRQRHIYEFWRRSTTTQSCNSRWKLKVYLFPGNPESIATRISQLAFDKQIRNLKSHSCPRNRIAHSRQIAMSYKCTPWQCPPPANAQNSQRNTDMWHLCRILLRHHFVAGTVVAVVVVERFVTIAKPRTSGRTTLATHAQVECPWRHEETVTRRITQ